MQWILCRVFYEGAAYMAVLKNFLCLLNYLRIIRRADYRAEITVGIAHSTSQNVSLKQMAHIFFFKFALLIKRLLNPGLLLYTVWEKKRTWLTIKSILFKNTLFVCVKIQICLKKNYKSQTEVIRRRYPIMYFKMIQRLSNMGSFTFRTALKNYLPYMDMKIKLCLTDQRSVI